MAAEKRWIHLKALSDIISAAKEWYVFSGTLQRCCTLGFSSQPDVSAPCQIDQTDGQTLAWRPEG